MMKKVLITGGSGTLGLALISVLEAYEIVVFSRSIERQMRLDEDIKHPHKNVSYITGDVCDLPALRAAMEGCDVVIHAAAFKFIDLGERQARECARVNVLGSMNVIDAALDTPSVEKVIGISTDKVVYARNVYGASKHIMEKMFTEADAVSDKMFSCVRYANVLASTGSVLTVWERQAAEGKPLTITDKRMRRFFFSSDEAAHFVIQAYDRMEGGEVFVQKTPSYSIYDMAKELSDNIVETGVRPGEKLIESLIGDYEGEEFNSTMTGNGEIVCIK